jgi:flavin-dependent dehydrogenase
VAPWSDMVEVYWGGPCQFFVTPVGADEVGVAMLCGDPLHRIDQFLPHYPELARRLRGASQTSRDRGGSTTTFRLRKLFRGRIALVGDASGSVDALGGDGLSLCFQQAVALADAIAHCDLGAYQSGHRRLWRGPAVFANLMLLMGRLPRVRRVVWKQLESRPTLFSRALALHSG